MLFVVSGPSGVGKSRLVDLVARGLGWETVVPWTTRDRRDNEVDGRDYRFCSKAAFREMIAERTMCFWDYTLGHYYGYDRGLLERVSGVSHVIVPVLARMALRIRAEVPNCVSVFLQAGDHDVLASRLARRDYDSREMLLRQQHWLEEQEHAPLFDVEIAVAELSSPDIALHLLRDAAQDLS